MTEEMQIEQIEKREIKKLGGRNFQSSLCRRRKISFINERINQKVKQNEKKMKLTSVANISQVRYNEKIKSNGKKLYSSYCYQRNSLPSNKILQSKKEKIKQNLQTKDKWGSSRFSRFSSQDKTGKFDTEESFYHLQEMRRIKEFFKEDKLEKRLNMLAKDISKGPSKEIGRAQLRIYKQDIHRIIVNRFGKDRITTLLNTEYIQDFDSMYKTMKDLMNLKKEQVLVLSFLIMDLNKDGLITPDDLINLLGVKKQSSSPFNELIVHDVLKIVEYTELMKKRGTMIRDGVANPMLKDERLSFMKYRMNKLKQKKIKKNEQVPKRNLLTCRLHQRLYSLQEQPQPLQQKYKQQQTKLSIEEILAKVIKVNVQKNQLVFGRNQYFSINYERYSQIFWNQLPKIFIDFLFLFGGLQVAGLKYLSVDTDMDTPSPTLKEVKVIKQENKMQKIFKIVKQMNKLNKQLDELNVQFQFL